MLKKQWTVFGVASVSALVVAAAGLRAAPQQDAAVARSSVERTLSGMNWRFVGPYRGGRTLTVSGVGGDAKTFYLGAVDGGVWKTTNGGDSWQPLFDREPVQSIGAIEVAASDPNVIYVGTGEGCIRNDISYGNGMYKSTDAGQTWTHIGLDDSQHIPRLLIDPKNPDRVFVAALGHASGPNSMRGVYRTTDGGKNWKQVLFKDDKTGAVDLSFDPADSNIIYAALYQQIRMPWGASSGGPGSGLYKSTDGGDTWTQLTGHGLPDGVLGKIGVAVGADSKTVYAQIEAKAGGLYVSKDSGATWSLVNSSDDFRQRAWYFTHVFADPKNADVVYELNTGVFRSTDGGKTFRSVHGADSHGLWIDPTDPNRVITSNDGGASVTQDITATPAVWSSQANQPTAQFYHVDADDQTYWELYGEQQDAGSVAIPSHTDHGGIYASDVHGVGGGESGWAVPSPDGKYVYAGNYMAITRWEKDGEPPTVSINPWPENSMGWGAATLQHRFQWTAPIALSPFDSNTVYYGGEILYKSTDRGSHWTKISGDLTRNDKTKQQSSGGPVTQDNTSAEYYDTIFCIAESPKQRGLIWIGTDDGLVQVTRDGGKTWTNVTPPELKEPKKQWAKIAIVAPSPFAAGDVYVAARRNKMDDFAPYAYHSSDYGRTWTKIVGGIPAGSYVNSVKPDPQTRNLLYVGTELGAYVSFDDGGYWQPLQFNLPHSSVRDVVVHGNSLAIATHGRAFWILDDVTPLRDMASGHEASGPVTLFKPGVVYRGAASGRGGFFGRGATGPQPSGLSTPNPPEGPVFVDYVLKNKPAGPVTIEILDPGGHSVQTYTSANNTAPGAAPAPEAGRGGRGGRGGGRGGFAPVHVNVPNEMGFNRFAAPLPTVAEATTQHCIPNEVMWGGGGRGGAEVPPVGTFSVKLTVDGQSYTQPLVIHMDPKLHVSDADMMEQYTLAEKVRGQVDNLHDAVNDMLSLQKQLAELPNGKELSDKIQSVLDVMANLHSTSGEDPLNYAIGLDNKLADFANSVAAGRGKPTEGMMEVYNDLEPQYTVIMLKWNALQKDDIAAFNARQQQSGKPAIVPGPRPTNCGGRGRGGI